MICQATSNENKREHTGWCYRINLKKNDVNSFALNIPVILWRLAIFRDIPNCDEFFRKQITFGKITSKYGFLRINWLLFEGVNEYIWYLSSKKDVPRSLLLHVKIGTVFFLLKSHANNRIIKLLLDKTIPLK